MCEYIIIFVNFMCYINDKVMGKNKTLTFLFVSFSVSKCTCIFFIDWQILIF